MSKKALISIVISAVALGAVSFTFVGTCDRYSVWDLMSWGSDNSRGPFKPLQCICHGNEIVLEDTRVNDGYRRSICIGIRERADCIKQEGGRVDGKKYKCSN
jgi:hypothetical protein